MRSVLRSTRDPLQKTRARSEIDELLLPCDIAADLDQRYAIRSTVLLSAAETLLPDNVVEVLVGEAFNRLDPSAQRVV